MALFIHFRIQSEMTTTDPSEMPTVTMKSRQSKITMETDVHKAEFLPGTVIGCPEIGSEGNLSSFIHIWRGNLKAVDHSVVVSLPFEAIQVSLNAGSLTV